MNALTVVTGGTRGIGAGISEYLYHRGHHVVAVYRSDGTAAAALADTLDGGPGGFSAHRVDLTDTAVLQEFVRDVLLPQGTPWLLVNNAGSISRPAYWRDQALEDAHATVRANLDLTLNVIWTVAPLMAENGGGRIVNISSTYATLGEAQVLAYTAAKAGIGTLTKGLARDLGPAGVTVNTVSPAVVQTAMTDGAGGEFAAMMRERTPVRSLATPADVARCVEFLADNALVNGVDIAVDGGLHLVGP